MRASDTTPESPRTLEVFSWERECLGDRQPSSQVKDTFHVPVLCGLRHQRNEQVKEKQTQLKVRNTFNTHRFNTHRTIKRKWLPSLS